MSDRLSEGRGSFSQTPGVTGEQTSPKVADDGRYRAAAIVGLAGSLLDMATVFMAKFTVGGRTFGLLPGPGPGYAQRLGVNLLVNPVTPIIVLVACCMLLRAESRKDLWSGMLLGAGLMFGISVANRLLAKPFTGLVWHAGYWVDTAAYLMVFVAASMVAWAWFRTRARRTDPE
jgi:hypothetical protein